METNGLVIVRDRGVLAEAKSLAELGEWASFEAAEGSHLLRHTIGGYHTHDMRKAWAVFHIWRGQRWYIDGRVASNGFYSWLDNVTIIGSHAVAKITLAKIQETMKGQTVEGKTPDPHISTLYHLWRES